MNLRTPMLLRLWMLAALVGAVVSPVSPTAFADTADTAETDGDPLMSSTGDLLRVPTLEDFPRWGSTANVAEGAGIDGVSVRFADSSFFQLPGTTTAPSIQVTGTLPDGSPVVVTPEPGTPAPKADVPAVAGPKADIVLVAWSDAERRIVPEFSHTLEGPAYAVSTERMEVLPEGIIELQAVVRLDEQIVQIVRHPYYVSYTPPLSEEDPENSEGPGPEDPPKAPEDLLKDALEEYYKTVGPGIDGLSVAFAEANAVVYEIGSDTLFHLDVDGSTPDNADVAMVAFSVTEDRDVELFAHTPLMPGYQIDPAFMENLPQGLVLLQALVRSEGRVQQLIQAPLLVVVNNESGDAEWVLDPGYDSSFDDLPPGEAYVEHPTDDDGWTIFPLAADARVIYVSSSEGSDANSGFSPDSPVKTPNKGISLLRNRMPDRILFKRGDTFSLNNSSSDKMSYWTKSGRSLEQPLVIGAYGELGLPRPRFLTNGKNFMGMGTVQHVAVLDLYITANYRDPYSPDFKGGDVGGTGFSIGGGSDVYNLLIEGCVMEYFGAGFVVTGVHNNSVTGLTLRRNTVRYSYKPWDKGFSQGIYISSGARGILLEENFLDHNGWNTKVNRANQIGFNHNAYLMELHDVTVKNNIIVRGSMNGVKFRSDKPGASSSIRVMGNLFADNKVGMAMSADGSGKSQITFDKVRVDGNVVTNSGGMLGRVRFGPGIETHNARDVIIRQNLIFKKDLDNDWPGIKAGEHKPHDQMQVIENVVHRWNYKNASIWIGKNVSKRDNRTYLPDDAYTDPTTGLDRYAREVGLADRFALYHAMSQQRKGFWRPELTAPVINAEFREAFNLRAPDWSLSAPVGGE